MASKAAELTKQGVAIVLEPGDAGYEEEVAGFNAAIEHRPEVVVGARSTDDVVHAVRFARARRLRVAVQSTGHGAAASLQGGLLVTTRRIDRVVVEPAQRRAVAGAGARWGAVVAAAAPHGLAPIAGSSPTVGVVGFLAGGGIGPLVRSHGFGSDFLVGATVVSGAGQVLTAGAGENADVLWALRGGQPRLGIVTEVQLRLAELPALYAGSMFFEEAHIETAFRGWVSWTATADPRVTTSAAVARFPAAEAIPAPFRGRRLLALRFAYPGDANDGARLAAPLRALAPIYLDQLGPLPLADVAQIFRDPPGPVPAWASGGLLTHVDQDFASVWLGHVGAGTDAPFMAAELRHLGEATTGDVAGGSAVGGRTARFTFALIATNPAQFTTAVPDAEARVVGDLAPWLSSERNGNFAANPLVHRTVAGGVPAAVQAKLSELAKRHDPDGLFR
jgi:FAD/FMN-containing dehydrogenase